MDRLRNIVILRDLPSNVIEEAFVVLKKNQKAKKLEHIDNKNNFSCEKNGEDENEFIVREAELLIQNYVESNNNVPKENQNYKLNKKYKRLKRIATVLACCLFFAIIYILL